MKAKDKPLGKTKDVDRKLDNISDSPSIGSKKIAGLIGVAKAT